MKTVKVLSKLAYCARVFFLFCFCFLIEHDCYWASQVAQQQRGQKDPLEKEMATHSSILAWRIPWMEEPGGLQSMGSQRVRHDRATKQQLGCCY